MKYKIIVDSSSNMLKSDFKEENIDFAIAPLTIRVDDHEFVDDENLNTHEMLTKMNESKNKSSSSCPAPSVFLNEFEGSDYYFVFTISKKLSGAYNSALVAKDMSEVSQNIAVIDSELTAGSIELMVNECVRLIKENKSFEEIKEGIEAFVKESHLFFVLNKFDNLVKNGRMSKTVAFIASLANVKPLCVGEEGEIKIKEKIRTINGVFKRLVANIGIVCTNTKDRVMIISHTEDLKNAEILKEMIKEHYEFKDIIIKENRGLCSFYSLEGGIICSF